MSTPCTTLKIAVFAPIPRARVTRAATLNTGERASRRTACCKGFMESNTTERRGGFAKMWGGELLPGAKRGQTGQTDSRKGGEKASVPFLRGYQLSAATRPNREASSHTGWIRLLRPKAVRTRSSSRFVARAPWYPRTLFGSRDAL